MRSSPAPLSFRVRRKLSGSPTWIGLKCFLFLGIFLFSGTLLALDAKQVFDSVAASTVLIEDVDSYGSGIFLTEKGLILTNYHVVAANIALKVRARVKFGNRIALTELDNVRITKIHKDYDLALLEVTPPPNGVFIPARIVAQTPPLSTGIKCFAIGNPGGPGGKALELSITEGLVSAAFRKMDGLEYTQVSAQINPGNSGGPICDEYGRVIGITTWKMSEAEGIGFAIPTQRLNMVDFVDPKTRKPDMALAARAEAAGKKYYMMSLMAEGQDKQLALLASAEAYHAYMLANPNSVLPYDNLAIISRALGNLELAKKYAEAGMKIVPDNPGSCHILGIIALDADRTNAELAAKYIDLWFRGLLSPSLSSQKSSCAADIATTMVNQEKWRAAAYMLQWAEALAAPKGTDFRKHATYGLWTTVEQHIPAAEMVSIRSKTEGFSRSEFTSLAAGNPVASAPTEINRTPSVAIPEATPEQMRRLVADAAAKFASTQIPPTAEGLDCALPDKAGTALLAYAGWEVIISFPDLMKLGVFNLATCKIEGFIDCTEPNPLFAAGGRLLAVYSANNQTLEIYDLDTRRKITSKPVSFPGPVAYIGMGLLNPNRIFLLYHDKTKNGGAFFSPVLLSVPDLNSVDLQADINGGINPLWNMVPAAGEKLQGDMDETGNFAVVSKVGISVVGAGYYTIRSDNRVDFSFHLQINSAPRLGLNGKIVVARRSLLDPATGSNPYLKIDESVNPYNTAPTAGYPAFLTLVSRKDFFGFRLIGLPGMNSISTMPQPKERYKDFNHLDSKDQVETLLASSYCDRFAYVLPAAKKVVVFPLGLKGGEAGSGFAQPGKRFERKLEVADGSTVTIQSGPPGLKYDPVGKLLTWDVPADTKTAQIIQVIMLVKGADAKEAYVVEKISVP